MGLKAEYMSSIVAEWIELDTEHREFIRRVMHSNGGKHQSEPHYSNDCEGSGFIICTGSFKWETTKKFDDLIETLNRFRAHLEQN